MSAVEIRSLNGHKIADETARKSVEQAKTESKQYTDTKISQLINGAPTTLDTLGEIAAAMAENATVVEALDAAIGSKADKTYVDEAIANFPVGEPDWNAKEGEEGYIKNRTHYGELQENTVFEINFIGKNHYGCEGFVPITGQTYFVYLNGERYECIANEAYGQAGAYWNYIGSLGLGTLRDYELDNRYPFFFGSMYNNPNYCCICFKEAGEYQLIIKIPKETVVKQLDPKFIPTASDDEVIDLLKSVDGLPVLADENNFIFTDEADNILLI